MPRYSFTVHIDAPDAEAAAAVHEIVTSGLDDLNSTLDDGRSLDITSISASERDQQIRDLADEQFGREGELEFDEGCLVSEGDDNGAYVQGWRWVSFAGTDLDKDEEDE